MCQWNISVT